jgi:hypothetical protein
MQMRSRSRLRLAKHKKQIPSTSISNAENSKTSVAPITQKNKPMHKDIALRDK